MMAGLTKAKMVVPFKMDKKDKSYMHAKGLPQTLATEEGQAAVGGKKNVCLIYGAKKFMADDNVSVRRRATARYFCANVCALVDCWTSRLSTTALFKTVCFTRLRLARAPSASGFTRHWTMGPFPLCLTLPRSTDPWGRGTLCQSTLASAAAKHGVPNTGCALWDRLKPGEWEEGVPRLLRQYYNDPAATAELQARVVDWWYEYATKWRKQLTANVERLIAANKGDSLPEAPPLVPTDMPW